MPSRDSALLPAVFALLFAAIAAVGTSGDFPLSDDWAFAHVARSLAEGRGFDFLPWTGASLVVQAIYGAAACKLAGFSHHVLRLTTVAMSLAGVAALHALLRELGAPARTAAAGAFALAFCPLWFHLSFTFMTDVPFVALALAGAWLAVRGLERESRAELLAAGALLAAGFLVRQHAVWVAAAAAAAALLPSAPGRPASERSDCPASAPAGRPASAPAGSPAAAAAGRPAAAAAGRPAAAAAGRPAHKRSARPAAARIGDAACVLALPAVAVSAWALWALTSPAVPLAVQNKLGEAAALGLGPAANVAFRAAATAGFLLMPWAVVARPRNAREARAFACFAVPLAAAAAFAYAREGAAMFYLTNVLGDFTVGAETLRDALFLGRATGPSLGSAARALLTAASLASAASVASRLALALLPPSPRPSRAAAFALLALVLSAAGSLVQAHWYFDRYVLATVPLAAAALVALCPSLRPGPGFAAAAALLAAYGVAGTHDYMAWNRARWDLLAQLEASGVDARRIDGGVEYNAERLAAGLGTAPSDADARRGQPASRKSWWWVVDDEWVVAFGPLDGYAPADSRPYARWLPPGEGRVLALHRNAD